MSLNIVSSCLRNFRASGCCSTISFAKLTNLMDELVVLLPHFCDKLGFFEHNCCALSEMALFHCALHSENTCIVQALFCWVFAGTKPFDNTTISSLQVRHLNRAPDSRVVFDFFLGGWKPLKSPFRFSCPAILETTTGSCYRRLQQIRHSVA